MVNIEEWIKEWIKDDLNIKALRKKVKILVVVCYLGVIVANSLAVLFTGTVIIGGDALFQSAVIIAVALCVMAELEGINDTLIKINITIDKTNHPDE